MPVVEIKRMSGIGSKKYNITAIEDWEILEIYVHEF